MSLPVKVNELLKGIADARRRIDVASTINFLLDVYSSGKVNDDDMRKDLYEVCRDVYSVTMVGSSIDEITKKAKETAEDLLRTFKLESIMRRAMSKYRIPLP